MSLRILITVHHELVSDGGASGATLALAKALTCFGAQVHLLGHEQLPRRSGGASSLIFFPALVAFRFFVDGLILDVVDFASYDGIFLTTFHTRHRAPILAFHSHGLEHVVHDRLMTEVERGTERVSWRYWLYRGSIHLWLVAHAARRADVAFFLNRDERAYAIRHLRVKPERALLAINGLDEAFLKAADRVPADQPGDDVLNVAFVGTFIERKGIGYLVPALVEYLKRHPTAQASLLGTRVNRERVLRDFAADLRDRVRVVPMFERSELPQLLASSQVFVLPSLMEGFSLAGLEAMACGLVPVLTRGHGFEEYATDNVSGILIDRADTSQIVAALERLNKDRAEWRRMRDEAIRIARTFTWERAAAVQLAGYRRAMELRSRSYHHRRESRAAH